MAITEEPILSRVDRLDNLLRNLEEIRVGSVNNNNNNNRSSPKSSCASTVSSSNYGGGDPDHTTFCSSLDFSPTSRSLGKSCRPIEDVIIETQHKGTLIDRLSFMEDRVLKLEGEIESEKKRQVVEEEDKQQQQQPEEAAAAANSHHHHHHSHERNSPKKAIKRFVKSCVKSKGNSKKMILTC